ncbi:hypothetical protein [Rheinheimera sp. 4Y26]|uniref:hypothetical protein n=1 Tax=Rheinheimera sp. 4Y26 TaxID=2977811 RepID=UPI0021B0B370|nr:hypothetical protein [Rheinheimera sp. 4Y26]MCT6700905.1 hypothetical protein [Rheinheimera sp. 4Y26]
MSIALITSIATMAIRQGPNVIRGIASLFGGNDTASKVADIVEQVGNIAGLSPEQKIAKTAEKIAAMPPEVLLGLEQLKIELEKEQTRRQELAYSDQQATHKETQLTIRNGDNATDEYVRRTRPLMARQSFYIGSLYVIAMELLLAFGKSSTGADWAMALAIYTPALSYMGLRTLDGFAPFGKSSAQKPGKPA